MALVLGVVSAILVGDTVRHLLQNSHNEPLQMVENTGYYYDRAVDPVPGEDNAQWAYGSYRAIHDGVQPPYPHQPSQTGFDDMDPASLRAPGKVILPANSSRARISARQRPRITHAFDQIFEHKLEYAPRGNVKLGHDHMKDRTLREHIGEDQFWLRSQDHDVRHEAPYSQPCRYGRGFDANKWREETRRLSVAEQSRNFRF